MSYLKLAVMPALLAIALGASAAANAEVKYTLTHLKPSCEGSVIPIALNNRGQVLASVYPVASPRTSRPVMWSAGVPRDLNIGEAGELIPTAINDAGTVALNRTSDGAAFLVQTARSLQMLGRVMATQPNTRVTAINRYHQVAGYFEDLNVRVDQPENTPSYSFAGTARNEKIIGGLPTSSIATSINNAGQVVGYMNIAADQFRTVNHAFLYANGRVTDLGSLNGAQGSSVPAKINNKGVVVGYSTVKDKYGTNAFAYEAGQMYDLGALVSWGTSAAKDVNDAGDVVGKSQASHPGAPTLDAAFIRPHTGVMQDLNTLVDPASGWYLAEAVAINDKGQILVRGYKRERNAWQSGAVLLTPR
jgi:probable HAF family extracellular repeat protein